MRAVHALVTIGMPDYNGASYVEQVTAGPDDG
jgi:hypothetical protein